MCEQSDLGVVGLGNMGQNLSKNFARRGIKVSVLNRITAGEQNVVSEFIQQNDSLSCNISGFKDLELFVNSLKRPRKILLMITAGATVDEVIGSLILLIGKKDIIIDGGNSHYQDTDRRVKSLRDVGIHFIGCGISGGLSGALNGPALMPGGSKEGWDAIKDLFQKISVVEGCTTPYCNLIGPDGSGHFVKMVHNGIEYALMQIIAESYDYLVKLLHLSNEQISSIFEKWNNGLLGGYLMEITYEIITLKDSNGILVLDDVIDSVNQKGTGKDIAICALEHDVVVSTITEAVNARFVSNMNQSRSIFSQKIISNAPVDHENVISSLFDCIYCSQLIAISQGIELISEVSRRRSWNIDIRNVLSSWDQGCIIRSKILKNFNFSLENNTLNEFLMSEISSPKLNNFTKSVSLGIQHQVPLPVTSAALAYHQALCSSSLPSNLIQLQRDYFGSHGFEKKSKKGQLSHLSKDI